ncbi:tetratricopeptide-like helical [Diplodia corticola]|uniref:Tetratricopeptide-like helical n=1 Tax=Diplodia corticola TaxID=236234 RepID=A0A1J9R427_9PEZI|nr:tetratricopeptide-like helical [Diplodia corticola]OJD35360.1 tetratricopeptide-like helical [Diplodia corticola]
MPKKKQFLQTSAKQPARGKKKEPEPQTEDDFLDAADEFEKSAGKWRAGDAAKSARFFQRAVDAYAAGLQKFPQSFDLAYNKALLEYQIAQDLRIAAQIGPPLVDLLRQALDSHRFAIVLNPDNLDILFNTANVLSDLADRVNKAEAVPLLHESVQCIRHCLERQVQEYESLQAAFLAANSGDPDAPMDAAPPSAEKSSSGSSAEEYASVEEAVTESAILDSVFFMANTLADLLSIMPAEELDAISKDVETVVGFFTSGALQPYFEKLDRTVPEPEKKTPTLSLSLSAAPPKPTLAQPSEHDSALAEGSLAQARLFSAVSEAEYRRGERTAASWYAVVLAKFADITSPPSSSSSAPPPSLPSPADAHSALIDALSAIATATATSAPSPAAAAQAESTYLAQAPSAAIDSSAAEPGPPAAPQDVTDDDAAAAAVHADALKRAYHVLAATLSPPPPPSDDKAPQLYVALGDVHWRLRGAAVAGSQGDVAAAVAQARRAEACWEEAERRARGVGVQCAEEEVEARGKRVVSVVLRGGGGSGRVLGGGGEAREVAVQAVQEMREDELLGDVLAEHALKVLGAA